ncbi:MAG: SycD/LcrH family type III secretion system chaperone [Nitrospirae bacterium]|nr:SycD/LcrH family type III secretion system chaperone [Nitrospirota bacterium]
MAEKAELKGKLKQVETTLRSINALFPGVTTFQQKNGMSDDQMEAMYAIAYNLYQSGKYDEAVKVFLVLAINNPFLPKYWKGMGASLQMSKKYCPAVYAYTTAGSLDVKDPEVYLHLSECTIALGRKEESISTLKTAIEKSAANPAYEHIATRAQALLSTIDKKK